MVRTLAALTAVGALIAVPAVAQTNPAPPSHPAAAQAPVKSGSAMKSGASNSAASKAQAAKGGSASSEISGSASKSEAANPGASSSATTGSATPEKSSKPSIVADQKPNQLLASSFKGTDVIGSKGKKIGDVSDILFNRDGSIKAYIVSFGGFLGLGSKQVAIDAKSFQVEPGKKPGEVRLKLAMSQKELKQTQTFKPYKPPRSHAVTTGSAGGHLSGGMMSAPSPVPKSH